jgi:hypothetical protein
MGTWRNSKLAPEVLSMPLTTDPSLGEAAQAFQITLGQAHFVDPLPLPLSEYFRAEMAFAQNEVPYDSSEFAVCEYLISPVLKEVWKAYTKYFVLWSHMPLSYDADLSGTPDYFLAKKSHLGKDVLDKPYLLVVEAKKDDPARGWGQCLAAMVAAQKLNNLPDQVLYGITSSGRYWEFGKLQGSLLTRELRLFTLSDLDQLCAAVNFAFDQCRLQLLAHAAST